MDSEVLRRFGPLGIAEAADDMVAQKAGTAPAPKTQSHQALIVLGMHRSGTSALTRVLSLAGAELPRDQLISADGRPHDGNRIAGFWESRPLLLLHDEALASAGLRWDDPWELPDRWFASAPAQTLRTRLASAIRDQYGEAPLFVVKDPRISRLVPLWAATLAELGIEPHWLIAVRNPLEVAASLQRRDGMPLAKGLLLWLSYFLGGERHTRGASRAFVRYQDLLSDWRGIIGRIEETCGIRMPRSSFRAGTDVDAFLDHELRHHSSSFEELTRRTDVPAWVKDAFRWANRAASGAVDGEELLDTIAGAVAEAELLHGPVAAALERERDDLHAQAEKLAAEILELRQHLAASETQQAVAAQLTAELADVRQRLADGEAHRLQAAQLAGKLEELRTRLSDSEAQLGTARAELARVSGELSERDSTVVLSMAENLRLNEDLEVSLALGSEREAQLCQVVAELRSEVAGLQAQVARGAAPLVSGTSRVKVLAFYLPQYHPIAENDTFWGRGFTEWTNVTAATSLFHGHEQPRLPSELGFYDLRVAETREQQAALAREHGVDGFCYYYYWFGGRRLLDRPLQEIAATGRPDFPFCVCWANESWTRCWDGQDDAILLAHQHSLESDVRFLEELLPLLRDPRYITIDGKPVLLVYRADRLADPVKTTERWRELARAAGLPGLHLCAVWRVEDPLAIGFDALVEFPPHHFPQIEVTDRILERNDNALTLLDYAAGVAAHKALPESGFPVYRGVMAGFDNSPRRRTGARIYVNDSPELYGLWLEEVIRESAARSGASEQLVFINAWNEWGEGATLEPSRAHGRAYLEVTRAAIVAAGQEPRAPWEERLAGILGQRDTHAVASKPFVSEPGRGLDGDGREEMADRVEGLFASALDADADERASAAAGALTPSGDAHAGPSPNAALLQATAQALARAIAKRPSPVTLWLSLRYGLAGLALKAPLWWLTGRWQSRYRWWRDARRLLRTGLFDRDYYLRCYGDVAAAGLDPLYHYVRMGAAEGLSPNAVFDPARYLEAHPELIGSGENPLLHFLSHGVAELAITPPAAGAVASPSILAGCRRNEQHARSRRGGARPMLVVSHDAARAGSQLILLETVKGLAAQEDLELLVLLLGGGELEESFAAQAHTVQLAALAQRLGRDPEQLLDELVGAVASQQPLLALCNTVASHAAAAACRRHGIPVLSMVYELPTSIDSALGEHTVRNTVDSSQRVVVASRFVRDALAARYGIDAEHLVPLHTGVFDWDSSPGWRERSRAQVLGELGLPADTFLVLGCGTVHHRKGSDLFVQAAHEAVQMGAAARMVFIWVGPDQLSPLFREWCQHDIAACGLAGRVHFLGHRDDTAPYFGAADAFALTSREDPFPMVNLEAMARGVPVVAFSGSGGAVEALHDQAGILVPYLDVKAMARALVALCEAPHYHAAFAATARQRIERDFQWSDYVRALLGILQHDFRYRVHGGAA